MKLRAMKTKIPVALVGAASLCLGFAMTPAMANLNQGSQSPTENASGTAPAHVVLHGIQFDRKSGELGAGSKAELNDAAEIVKTNPNTTVFVGKSDATKSCNLSADEAKTIASYMEERGVPAGKVNVCQANSPRNPG